MSPASGGSGAGARPPGSFPALLLLALVLTCPGHVQAGHEMPFYPSYYPQEITIETLAPAAAAAQFEKKPLHAYVGGDPWGGRPLPGGVTAAESLDGYVVVTLNPEAPALREPAARCAAARRLIATFRGAGWRRHPYPVTPQHPDFLEHADLAEAAASAQQAATPAPRLPALRVKTRGRLAATLLGGKGGSHGGWDAIVEEVRVTDLIAPARTGVNGWTGPPWLKEGWFHAWLLLRDAVADNGRRQETEEAYRRLTTGGAESAEERVNLQRGLVARLGAGCERVVAGYINKREVLNHEYSAGVENVAADSQAGLGSEIFVRTVKLKDFPWNGWLTVGVPDRPAAAWNPIGGFSDATGRLVWAAVGDPALFPEPHNASWTANRVRLDPSTTVLGRPIPVPRDALLPERGTGLLREVGEGRTARARLTFRVLGLAFHDGTRLAPADIFYALGFAFRWGAGRGPESDEHVERATALGRSWLAGLRLVRVDTDTLRFGDVVMKYEVPVVEVYLAHALPDAEQLASVSPPWSSLPWHGLALMEEAVKRRLGAFSEGEARRRGVPWLDPVRDQGLRERLAALVGELESQGWVPEALRGQVTPREARQRLAALARFAAEHGHFLVTNGPYLIHAWSPATTVLRVFRDFSYPLGVGSYNAYAIPLRAFVARAELRGDRVEIHAKVERIERFAREYRIVTEPLTTLWGQRDRGAAPRCRFLIVAGDGTVLRTGAVAPSDPGLFVIGLGDLARRGPLTVLVAPAVNANHVNAHVKALRVD